MKVIPLLVFIFLILSCTKNNKVVYEWRGSNREGIYQEKNLVKEWPENGPALNWEFNNLGSGYGSPVITDEGIYIVSTHDSLSYLQKLSLEGESRYTTILGREWTVNFPGSRSTPTIVDDLVYVATGTGEVVCLERKTGLKKWAVNMLTDFNGVAPRFGYAQSLVVDDKLVYCCPGGEQNNVVALNRFNGEVVWTHPGMGERPAYHPAKIIEVGNMSLFITFSAYHLMAFNAENGQLIWTHEQINTAKEDRKPGIGDTHANGVLFEAPMLYYIEGDGNCAVALEIAEDGSEIQQRWNNAAVDNYMGGYVNIDEYIYSCGYSSRSLCKVDKQNGAVVNELEIGRGSVIAANNHLYYYNEKGEVYLVAIANDEMKVISSFKIEKGSREHFAHPVISNGVLYLRHGEYLGAFDIKKE